MDDDDGAMTDADPICLIPARGTSPGLPKKNFKRLDGDPLVAHSIRTGLACDRFRKVYVSTESEELATIARDHGATVPFLRPPELSRRDAMLRDVVEHALDEIGGSERRITPSTPVTVLQPNIPFRRPADVERALDRHEESTAGVVVSVVEERDFFWRDRDGALRPLFDDRQTLRDDLEPTYRETGSITVTTSSAIRDGVWTDDRPDYVVTDALSSFEVDAILDFWLAEQIAEGPSFVFRVDGGGDIGLGKVYRAVTLAREIASVLDCDATFVCRSSWPEGVELVEGAGFDVTVSDSDEEAVASVVDHDPDVVFLDVPGDADRYLEELHQTSAAVLNLESLGENAGRADYVVNPQRDVDDRSRWNHLAGTDYLVVRDEFRGQSPAIPERAENVLITFGGSDPSNLTTRTVRALGGRDLPFTFRVVLGPGFEHADALDHLPDEVLEEFEILSDVESMGAMTEWADLAVTAGGRTVYELAATGTPSVVLAQNVGEMERMELLRKQGAISFLGRGDEVDGDELAEEVQALARDRERRLEMSEEGRELIDGRGVQRLLDLLHEILVG